MRIRKTYNGVVPNGKLLNSYSTSQNDGYSCDFINDLTDAQEVDYTQYFNLDTTNVINTINAIYCVKIGKLVFFNYDFALKNSVSVTNGQLVIGTCTDKLAYTAYGFGRTARNSVVYPATSIAITGGQFRIMPHDTNRPEYIAGEVIFITTD